MNEMTESEPVTGEVMEPLPREVSPIVAAEINQLVATAKRYPRRDVSVMADEIRKVATYDKEIATECMYSVKRGDKAVTGPSIRFAEIVMATYGNLRAGARFVRIDDDIPERQAVIVEGVCHDVQNNNLRLIQSRRSIMTSGRGGRAPHAFNADMTNMAIAAQSSIAAREAILRTVPKTVWGPGFQRVVEIVRGDAATFSARLQEIIAAFGRVGAQPQQVLDALGVKDVRDVTMDHMPELWGFMNAIKDGENVLSVLGRGGDGTPAHQHEVVRSPLQEPAIDGQPQTQAANTLREAQQAPEPAKVAAVMDEVKRAEPAPAQPVATAALPANELDPKPATAVVAPGAAGDGGGPSTPEDYAEGFEAFLSEAKTPQQVRDRWAKESPTRKRLGVGSAMLGDLAGKKDARIAALTGA
jgi:hypothetical protein